MKIRIKGSFYEEECAIATEIRNFLRTKGFEVKMMFAEELCDSKEEIDLMVSGCREILIEG